MAENEQKKPKKKSKRKWIVLILILLIIGGGGAAGWFLFGKKLMAGEEKEEPAQQVKVVQALLPPSVGIVVPLDTLVVNLSDPLGRRYIRVAFEAELTDEAAVVALAQLMPKIKDSLIMLLASKTYADVASHENRLILKSEVVERLNQVFGGPRVMQVYITDMVIQ